VVIEWTKKLSEILAYMWTMIYSV